MLSAGTMLGGRYRLSERIAGGGMGDVWRGTDEVLGRTVAVKVLLPALMDDPGFVERFRGEARTMATINHPGVVDIYDYGSESGTAFLVMEYVEGEALSETLTRVRRLTPARTMALLAQAAEALHAAHQKGVVHRDVKPGNLLVRPNGTLVLTDFGIARSADAGQLTAVGSVLGTASYISPEQASGATATVLSDVYALGVVAYQCLAGRRPFDGDNAIDIAMRHITEPPPPLPPDIPPAARQIVERALAKDPNVRWPTAAVLAQVARRASAQLASGAAIGQASARPPSAALPTQGGSRPVSGGGRPTSGGPRSQGPAGSAMGPNASGAGPGPNRAGAARGSAGVPVGAYRAPQVPPRPPDGPPGLRTPGGAGSPGGARSDDSRRALTTAAVLAVLLVLIIGVVWAGPYLTSGGGGTDPTPGPSSDGGNPEAVQTVQIPCRELKGRSRKAVESTLTELGLSSRVNAVDVDAASGIVTDVPCEAPSGTTVTIDVASGKGRSRGKATPTGGGTRSSKPTPTSRPSGAAPTSAAPSGPPSGEPSCDSGIIGDLLGKCPPSTRP